jgi:hypothetical protein
MLHTDSTSCPTRGIQWADRIRHRDQGQDDDVKVPSDNGRRDNRAALVRFPCIDLSQPRHGERRESGNSWIVLHLLPPCGWNTVLKWRGRLQNVLSKDAAGAPRESPRVSADAQSRLSGQRCCAYAVMRQSPWTFSATMRTGVRAAAPPFTTSTLVTSTTKPVMM